MDVAMQNAAYHARDFVDVTQVWGCAHVLHALHRFVRDSRVRKMSTRSPRDSKSWWSRIIVRILNKDAWPSCMGLVRASSRTALRLDIKRSALWLKVCRDISRSETFQNSRSA